MVIINLAFKTMPVYLIVVLIFNVFTSGLPITSHSKFKFKITITAYIRRPAVAQTVNFNDNGIGVRATQFKFFFYWIIDDRLLYNGLIQSKANRELRCEHENWVWLKHLRGVDELIHVRGCYNCVHDKGQLNWVLWTTKRCNRQLLCWIR